MLFVYVYLCTCAFVGTCSHACVNASIRKHVFGVCACAFMDVCVRVQRRVRTCMRARWGDQGVYEHKFYSNNKNPVRCHLLHCEKKLHTNTAQHIFRIFGKQQKVEGEGFSER